MEESNCFLINAPAGSGKTTYIYSNILKITIKSPNAKILCITYTNRAANELKNKLQYHDNKKLEVYTIHSFINNFMDNYFKKTEIIDEYLKEYIDEIKKIIENPEDENNKNKIEKYKEKFGDNISLEIIRDNIIKIYYNETNFNSYLYGGLSHDELIRFTYLVSKKYENILFKLSNMYNYVFIDEYQDTPQDVLKLFYECLKYSKVKLYLFGDKMQQIYDNYNTGFDQTLNMFDKSIVLKNNYRSTKKIVNILNNIYNDEQYKQIPKSDYASFASKTLCIITDDYESEIKKYNNFYKLFLLNREKYTKIGASNLYSAIDSINNYSHNGKYNVADALEPDIDENKDILFKPLYIINYIIDMYQKSNYGEIFRTIEKYKSIFNIQKICIKTFDQVDFFKEYLKQLYIEYTNSNNTIEDFLTKIKILNDDYLNNITTNEEYERVLNVKLGEFINYVNYINNMDCSTQHGVKGEGHDNILFISDSSSSPNVNIYEFYKLYSKSNIKINDFEKFNLLYTNLIINIEGKINTKINKINKEMYLKNSELINDCVNNLYNELKEYELFDLIENKYQKYINNGDVTSLKNLLKKGYYQSILSAYKIFYVGCSRAKKNLIVLIKKSEIVGYQDELKRKLETIGFDVEIK